MIADTFLANIRKSLPFGLTQAQEEAVRRLCVFIFASRPYSAYVLRGYAGTGKTTVTAAVIRQLHKLGRETVLLAPTGRAAKVLSQHSGFPAFTIHKEIYRQKQAGDLDSAFDLDINRHRNAVFFVDEASMISNAPDNLSPFGSGRILEDLVTYVYGGVGCCLVFIGDNAQLPPVGEDESPALSVARLKSMGLEATGFQLATVMRQTARSGILHNATAIRHSIAAGDTATPPSVSFSPFSDICNVIGGELIESLESDYSRYGTEEVVVITRSNKQAVRYNLGIRSMIFGREETLSTSDAVMIVRNNYYWTEQYAAGVKESEGDEAAPPVNFLANGDIALVTHIGNHTELYGLHFADVTLRFPDYSDFEMDVRVLLDTLTSESPSLTREQSEALYRGVMEDYSDITNKKERVRKIRLDPNFNAVQIKYAYAVTCHKAQGGQWSCVYLDQGWLPPDSINLSYYRWLYTAFTRATRQLSLVNWPERQSG